MQLSSVMLLAPIRTLFGQQPVYIYLQWLEAMAAATLKLAVNLTNLNAFAFYDHGAAAHLVPVK